MNTLGYAILGLIDKEKLTGYDLTKIFSDSVADFWSAKQSQIYTELKKLVDENLIEYQVVIQGEILEKKVYSITIRGKEELQSWMLGDEPSLPQHKDIFKLRLYFSENLPHENLLKKFENRQEKILSLLARYTLKIKEYTPESIAPKYLGDYLLLKGAIASLKSQLEWIDESLTFLKDYKPTKE